MRSLTQILFAKNRDGEGAKQYLHVRAHSAFKQALRQRSQAEHVSMAEHLVQSALDGDQQLRQLTREYLKTSDAAK